MKKIFSWCYAALAVLAAAAVLCVGAEQKQVAAMAAEEGVKLPIIMYHSVLDSEDKAGKYVVTPAEFEADVKYILERGCTPVLMRDVVDYVKRGRKLPPKPIVLTFDDGCYNFYSYVYPLLEKYDICANVAVIGRYADMYSALTEPKNNSYTCLNWDELREMQASGRVEVMNHSYDMHGETREGLKRKTGETDAEYEKSVKRDIERMQQRMGEELGEGADVFVYPFGYTTDIADSAVREIGFESTLICYEHVNTVTTDPASLYNLGRFNRPHGVDSHTFFDRILL